MNISDENKIYKSMIIGVALFVGGMVALLLIMKHLNPTASASQSVQTSNVVLRPIVQPSQKLDGDIIIKPYETHDEEFFNMKVNVTDAITDLYEQSDGFPWTSVDITNNGPSPVYISVNNWKTQGAPLEVGNTISVDFKRKASINKLYLKCNAGEATTVSLFIVRG